MLRLATRSLAIGLISSSLALFSVGTPVVAADKNLRVIGGGYKHKANNRNHRSNNRRYRNGQGYRHNRKRSHRDALREGLRNLPDTRFASIGSLVINEDGRVSFADSFLRNKVTYSPQRSIARILHVTDEQLALGEKRAERREAKMLDQIDTIEFGYYRPNEAYDVRFPSIVYLDATPR